MESSGWFLSSRSVRSQSDAAEAPQGTLASIRAFLRWPRGPRRPPGPPRFGPVYLDEANHRLVGPRGSAHLSRTEFLLLQYFISQRARVLPQAEILGAVWGDGYASSYHVLHDAVSRLRHRFEAAGVIEDPLQTLHGVGYRLRPAA